MPETRRRRLPTRDELQIWRGYIETAEAVRSALTARLHSESSLSSSDYPVLLALSEAHLHQLRSSELAAAIGWERSRLSHHIARMEARGLLRREPCAEDNRGALVVLAESGLDMFRRSTVPHLSAIRELFVDAFSPEQLRQIEVLTRVLHEHLEATAHT